MTNAEPKTIDELVDIVEAAIRERRAEGKSFVTSEQVVERLGGDFTRRDVGKAWPVLSERGLVEKWSAPSRKYHTYEMKF